MQMSDLITLMTIVMSIAFILIIFFRRKPEKIKQVQQNEPSQNQAVKTLKQHSVKVGSFCKARYDFYPISVFKTCLGEQLYKDIIVENLWIQEPFHTVFITLLKFYEDHDDCVKSESTNTIMIKIAKTNEAANAYKVYSVQELVFRTVYDVYNYIKHKYTDNDIQLLLIATLLFKIDLLRSMSQIFENNRNLICEKILPKKCRNCQKIMQIINQIRAGEEQFDFINIIFQNSKRIAYEYPYEDSQKLQNDLLPLSRYDPKIKKNLLSF